MKLSTSILLASTILMQGCAPGLLNEFAKTDSLSRPGFGQMAGTISYRTAGSDLDNKLVAAPRISANFGNAIKNGRSPSFYSGDWDYTPAAIDMPPERRVIVMQTVPVGRYHLTEMRVEYNAYFMNMSIYAPDAPYIEVKEGEISYFGNVKLTIRAGTNLFGKILPADGKMTLNDDFYTDTAAMKGTDPRLENMKITNGLTAPP